MAQKLTITRIYTTDKRKDGSTLTDKSGNTILRVAMKTQEYGDRWMTGFIYPKQKSLFRKGAKIEADVREVARDDGEKDLMFKLVPPANNNAPSADVSALREEIAELRETLSEISSTVTKVKELVEFLVKKEQGVPMLEEDIPF